MSPVAAPHFVCTARNFKRPRKDKFVCPCVQMEEIMCTMHHSSWWQMNFQMLFQCQYRHFHSRLAITRRSKYSCDDFVPLPQTRKSKDIEFPALEEISGKKEMWLRWRRAASYLPAKRRKQLGCRRQATLHALLEPTNVGPQGTRLSARRENDELQAWKAKVIKKLTVSSVNGSYFNNVCKCIVQRATCSGRGKRKPFSPSPLRSTLPPVLRPFLLAE